MPSVDGDSLQNSFDYFDNFLKSRSASVEEEVVEDEVYEEVIEDVEDSSSSYYEEELLEETLIRDAMRLDTLHENDEDSSYDSETEPWEEVTDSFHCDSPIRNVENSSNEYVDSSPEHTDEHKRNEDTESSPEHTDEHRRNSFDAGELAEALRANSDMIERVRNMLSDKYQGDGSLVDSSSRCDSTSYDDCGSSSVLPLDFDMGSCDGLPNDSDEEEESIPDDYEEACRAMIATVHPQLDPHTMLHGCDLRNLYRNLKQQYGHVLKSVSQTPAAGSNTPVAMEEEPAVIEDDETTNFVDMSFNSHSDGNADTVPPEPMVSPEPVTKKKTNEVRNNNNSSVIMTLFGIDPVGTGTKTPPKVEKWFHRDADDPEDYEYACRVLCEAMYDPNDPDYDVDTMLSRSTPKDLYRYLKPHYWYLAHSNQLDENGIYVSKFSAKEAEEEKQVNIDEKKVDEEQKSSNKVDALRSFFANRAEKSDRSATSHEETSLEPAEKSTEMQEEKSSDDCDQPSVSQSNKDIEDIASHSDEDETETEMQPSFDESESVTMEYEEHSEDSGSNSDYDEYEQEMQPSFDESESVTMEPNESNEDASSHFDVDATEIEMNESVTIDLNESNEDEDSSTDDDGTETEAEIENFVDEDEDENESVTMEPNESNRDASSHSVDDETETEIDPSFDENESMAMESSEGDQDDGSYSEENETQSNEDGLKERSHGDESCDKTLFREASPNDTVERPLIEREHPVHSSGEATNSNNAGSSEPCEDLDDAAHNMRQDIESSESLNDSCGSLWEQYSGEYNDMLAKKTSGEEIDETRFRLLELSVKYIRGQRLLEEEIRDVEDFFNQETTMEEENAGDKELKLNDTSESTALPADTAVDSKDNGVDESIDEQKSPPRRKSVDGKTQHSVKSKSIPKSKMQSSHDEGQKATMNPNELEWRKGKIEKDLNSLINETEVRELREPLSPGVRVALNAGSMKTALTKKYYDKKKRDYVYYPSVAKALENFTLIEEAEKTFHNEFSFELSTALCTVAASHTRGSEKEVNENDKLIKESTVDVVLKEENHNTISFSESFRAKGGKAGLESPDEELPEKKVRIRRIRNDLERIIKDAEKNHLGGKIQAEAIDALGRAANEIVFIKKYYDVDTDMFKYFPSMKKTILNCSLMERAEDFYFDGMQDFPLDYASALKAAAARFCTDFVEVNELDDYVINMAVDVDIEIEGNQSKRSRDFSMTADTASMMSSQTTEGTTNEQINELEDVKIVDSSATAGETVNKKDDDGTLQAALDEKSSLLMQNYLEKRQKIDEALVDLESELVAEMNRLDKEAADCSLKHKVEAERIEQDRREVHKKAIEDAKQTKEKVKSLREQLSGTVAVLQFDVNGALSSMDAADAGKDSWGSWLSGKSKVDKEKQKRVTKTKERKAKLEKQVSEIKAQLEYVNQQAKAKRQSVSEWKTELDEEQRHLVDLTSATEAKLKEEMMYLKASYEEERQRLLNQRNLLEEIQGEDEKCTEIPRPENEQEKTQTNAQSEEEKSIQSSATTTAVEEEFNGQTKVEIDRDPLPVNIIGEGNSSEQNNDSTVPDHLASLNQPRDANDEASLGSFDLFEPEDAEGSGKDLSNSGQRAKSNPETKTKPTEQGKEISEEQQDEFIIDSPVPRGGAAKKLSSKKFLAAALKGKQKADNTAAKAEAGVKRVDSVDRSSVDRIQACPEAPKSPAGKSLRDMKRKVEEALDRAMAIRNGSSRHSRSLPVETGSDPSGHRFRSVGASPISPSRKSVNPIYPMVKEIDRLQGFMRRYEKKLETVCKTVLTLASVARDEKDISDARQLELPEMLEFVVNQDFYKEHSKDKEAKPPQLLFAKSATNNGAGDIRYSITPIGKSFFEIEGPVSSDLSRFLSYLSKIEDGLTRDAMKAQWKEIANLSGDEQSQRVCDNLDKFISFCVDSHMIQK